MLFSTVKKQLLLLIRRPQELLILLLMPLILIAILGFSLGSFTNGEATTLHANVALVEYGDEQVELQAFLEKVERLDVPDELKGFMKETAKEIAPLALLKNLLSSEQLQDHISLEIFSPDSLEEIQSSKDYTVIIKVEENFTTSILERVLLGEENTTGLILQKNESEDHAAQMVEDIITNFQNQFHVASVAGSFGVMDIDTETLVQSFTGSVETLNQLEPISSFEYYTIGMSVMFILFIASYVSSFAYEEKKLNIFDRILLSNTSRWSYYTGIVLSGFVLAFLQQLILYGVTSVVYGIRFDDFFGFLLINLALSFAVGGFAAILTAVSFIANTEAVSNFFNGIFVMILAFLGGSFTPTSILPDIIGDIGKFTPNGNAMNAMMKLMQGYNFADVSSSALYLFCLGAVLLIIGILFFPKRGKAV